MRPISKELCADVALLLDQAAACSAIVDVSSLAEAIRQRHSAENVALEDIEALIVQRAGLVDSAMLLGRHGVS